MSSIDAHVHVWTPDLVRYPLAAGYRALNMEPRSFTPEELFAHARPCGVTRVNLIQMSFYGFDNSYMLSAIRQYPGVFVGTAVVDPLGHYPEREMVELARQRVRAFRIAPRLSRQPASDWLRPQGYAKMFAAGARHNLAMSCLIDLDGLPELDRMCQTFAETPVIIDHLCRIGVDGPIRAQDVEALCAMARHRRVMVKVGAFYALGRKEAPYLDLAPMIERVVGAFGVERCMWESDCPFQVSGGHNYRDSIELVQGRLPFLSEGDRDWLLRRTAEGFFFAG